MVAAHTQSLPYHSRREATVHLGPLLFAAPLVLATLATPLFAQDGKVSSTGRYKATVTCGSGVADVPGPNGEAYTIAGMFVWDAADQILSRPSIVCGQTVTVGGAGAATMYWQSFVIDKSYKQVKSCTSEPKVPVTGGRFPCKSSGNLSITLTLRPE
jgi:hypothetical protein